MKKGSMFFFILAFINFVSFFISLTTALDLGLISYIIAFMAFLQAIAWTLVGWMWETVME